MSGNALFGSLDPKYPTPDSYPEADDNRPMDFLTGEANSAIWKEIHRTKPSDIIQLKGTDEEKIHDLWRGNYDDDRIPSDLFFAGLVPLLDCQVSVDARRTKKDPFFSFRVVIFEDYQERIRKTKGDVTVVGATVGESQGLNLCIPIGVREGADTLLCGPMGWQSMSRGFQLRAEDFGPRQNKFKLQNAVLTVWYGIQIALLHPTVKEVFQHPKMDVIFDPDAPRTGRNRRITRYIRKHVINADELDTALYVGPRREFARHTLVWYVIGHWRHYADGRKAFVQPYWKGPMRDLKRNLDDGRERLI